MRNPTYLIRSRYQSYYFRWPFTDKVKRITTLQTAGGMPHHYVSDCILQ